MKDLEKRVAEIEKRNKKVEEDKGWETSFTRRGLLILFTYISIGAYMWAIGVASPWLNAVIPSIGFLLSTLTLQYFKRWWVNNRKK
ncbi:hypothetical protein A2803_03465 [Candidatus Woesebacteria bacterium RIFCSPHIGHO2_01_FULL_44_21]|uniref:2TM domain-containing protein n=1 Tax=Candidatus Woesebacteria bacterium RIFCSPHIGHO2_01_FULL_44_21 TaxID=1802503 RepID=A0A1F7Z0L5_9BACT|nr:MAG: hypothetical protein A2803_03465 [Candidatus Woesebacteria bacterium RIFCSPHIGHO2_01_FULL_44_21]OGM69112.1 MAG: hypothetical protein A2897_04775 [Candidatus Woesebacteria bacterium RIFCSPLOWO2_01_FULL_44_24b]